MISFEYRTDVQSLAVNDLTNRVVSGTRGSMQLVLDELVANIKRKFSDTALADTVIGFIRLNSQTGDGLTLEGVVTSTWPAMIHYEKGRKPGGKMPPIQALMDYATKHGIQPDPAKTAISFAYAVNHNRVKRDLHALPVDVIVNWQAESGFSISEEFALRSMAFAMAKKIQRDGIPGKHYFEQGLEETRPFIHQSFEQVVIHSNA